MNEKKFGFAMLLLLIFPYLLSSKIVVSIPYHTLSATAKVTIKSTYYLHRTDVSGVTPAGKLMNTKQPLSIQSEITYTIDRGLSVYFYTSNLSEQSIVSGTWTLYLWASTATSGETSQLTVEISLVSLDGLTIKQSVGNITDVTINYGYSERIITISGSAVTITSGDRIRLKLLAQDDPSSDPSGMIFYYDGYGTYETLGHETRLHTMIG